MGKTSREKSTFSMPDNSAKWSARRRAFEALEAQLTWAVSERMLDLAQVGPGQRVLDLATGAGEPALRAARRVGPAGRVLGVDVDQEAIERTRAMAMAEQLTWLEVRHLSAEDVDQVPEVFEVVTARWGLMSMKEPRRALAGARSRLEGKGCVVSAVWADAERVDWWRVPREVTGRFATLPVAAPNAPGALRYASLETVERDFAAAGFGVEHVEELRTPVVTAPDGRGIVDWVRVVLGRWVDLVPVERQADWEAELADECERHHREGGQVSLGGVTRVVVARPR